MTILYNLNNNNAFIGGEFIKTQSEAQKNGRYSNRQLSVKTPSLQDPLPGSIITKQILFCKSSAG
jgi:hypothetical protein